MEKYVSDAIRTEQFQQYVALFENAFLFLLMQWL